MIQPVACTVIGGVGRGIAAPERGSSSDGACSTGEARTHVVEATKHLTVGNSSIVAAVGSCQLHEAARVEVTDIGQGVTGDLLVKQLIGIVLLVELQGVLGVDEFTLLIILADGTREQLHRIVVLEIAVNQVAAIGAPEVVVTTLGSISAATGNLQGSVVIVAGK